MFFIKVGIFNQFYQIVKAPSDACFDILPFLVTSHVTDYLSTNRPQNKKVYSMFRRRLRVTRLNSFKLEARIKSVCVTHSRESSRCRCVTTGCSVLRSSRSLPEVWTDFLKSLKLGYLFQFWARKARCFKFKLINLEFIVNKTRATRFLRPKVHRLPSRTGKQRSVGLLAFVERAPSRSGHMLCWVYLVWPCSPSSTVLQASSPKKQTTDPTNFSSSVALNGAVCLSSRFYWLSFRLWQNLNGLMDSKDCYVNIWDCYLCTIVRTTLKINK